MKVYIISTKPASRRDISAFVIISKCMFLIFIVFIIIYTFSHFLCLFNCMFVMFISFVTFYISSYLLFAPRGARSPSPAPGWSCPCRAPSSRVPRRGLGSAQRMAYDDGAWCRNVGTPYERAYALSSYALTYVYIYIYMYVCMCVYIYIYIYLYIIYIYIYIIYTLYIHYIHIYICVYIYIYIYMHYYHHYYYY